MQISVKLFNLHNISLMDNWAYLDVKNEIFIFFHRIWLPFIKTSANILKMLFSPESFQIKIFFLK